MSSRRPVNSSVGLLVEWYKNSMSKENMIDRMTLFIRKGAGLLVRSRKEQSHEDISLGIGAYQTRSSVASPLSTFAGWPDLRLRISGRSVPKEEGAWLRSSALSPLPF